MITCKPQLSTCHSGIIILVKVFTVPLACEATRVDAGSHQNKETDLVSFKLGFTGRAYDFEDMGAHQHRSLGFGLWTVLGAMAGFEQVHGHFRAGSLSRDRRPDEPKYGTRHDHSDAGCPVVDSSSPVHIVQRATRDLLSGLDRISLVHRCPARNRAC